jgi:alpha-D-ribose 1-methylphosphonate 5-triphosphate synthase subunit PhnH
MSGLDRAGFADPVTAAQACFRAVLDAMARPGRIRRVGHRLSPPPPLSVAAGAVLLTLADADTPLWLDPDASAARNWLAFHCAAPLVADRAAAALGLALGMPALADFAPGTHAAPEASATLIVEVASLGSGRRYRLAGPGLPAPAPLRVDGLPGDFIRAWKAQRAAFPLGVDLVLCTGDSLCALPRTVAIEEA